MPNGDVSRGDLIGGLINDLLKRHGCPGMLDVNDWMSKCKRSYGTLAAGLDVIAAMENQFRSA
jgi:hypothetical protein